MFFYETFFILLSFCMHFKYAKNFFAKLCKTMFFAHMGCAVALTANRNKIAKICKFRTFAKKLQFFQKTLMLFYFLPYRYSTIFFVIFKNLPSKEIFALKFFFAKIKFFTQYQSKFFCNVLLKTLQISSYKLFYFS